ncbi:MAG TPA: hypothetical protein VGR27_07940 [Longimicrobiaceae bacterium]|nr:hypothetical protein [Longimicrobiaceae bacterium]
MPRFLYVLLLLASFWPAAAGAGTDVRVQDRIAPLPSLEAVVRAAGGIELLRELERNGSIERSSSSSRDLPPHGGGSSPSARSLRPDGAAALGRQGVVLPRLAHLPYFATAPPLPR